MIAQTEGRFASIPSEKAPKPAAPPGPIKVDDLFDTTDLKPEPSETGHSEDVPMPHKSQKTFELLMTQQSDAFKEIKNVRVYFALSLCLVC